MKTTIEKLKQKILETSNKEISFELDSNSVSLVILNEAPYYSLHFCDLYIHLECFWRAIINSEIIFSIQDDNQKFGLEKPIAITKEFQKFFASKQVSLIKIKNPVSDLQILFEDGSYIEAFASSSGYETWSISGNNIQIICLGGGSLAVF